MIRITKGDITLECETQADVKLALGVFADVDMPALPSITVPVEVNAPDWRVGGPGDAGTQLPLMSGLPGGHIEKPKLAAVQDREQTNSRAFSELHDLAEESRHYLQDDEPSGRMHVDMGFDVPQYIPVSAKKLDVLEAVLLFPEGVPANGVAQLLGLTQKMASGRLQMLRLAGLAELVPHSTRWRATQLARRAKLVRS